MIKSIYNDLSFYAKFDGILFHDDAFLTDFEGVESHSEGDGVTAAAKQKRLDLIGVTDELTNALKPYFLSSTPALKTVRSLHASVITNPKAEEWFAQNLTTLTKHYDTTAIMAMPYMEHHQTISAKQAEKWFAALIQRVKAQAPLNKVLFEFQSVNLKTKQPIPETELISWIELLQRNGIYSYGYYPDNFVADQPNMQKMRRYMSLNTQAGKP